MNTSISQILFFLLVATICSAQSPSGAYLVNYSSNDGNYSIENIGLISSFNKTGYNNQPFFDGDELYLSCSRGGLSRNNTDLVKLNIPEKQLKYLTHTSEQEFSPTLFAGKLYFVKFDRKTKYQELWSIEDGQLTREMHFTNVAYYKVINREHIAVVLLENDQLNLYLYNGSDKSKKLISRDVGRSLHLLDSDHLMFVHKYSNDYWHLKKYSITTGRVSIVQKTIKGAEDFFIDRKGKIWMGKDSKIYTLNLETASPEWQAILDLEKFDVTNIKRLTTNNNNQIVVINQ